LENPGSEQGRSTSSIGTFPGWLTFKGCTGFLPGALRFSDFDQ
jgi:hypothetical protein